MARMSKEEAGRAKMLQEIASGKLTPLKAIKLNCLDCVCYDRNEVAKCPSVNCPLHAFRFGRNPYGNELSEEELKNIRNCYEEYRAGEVHG